MGREFVSLARRAEECGLLVAGTNVPLTLQRTLMPRGTIDQAIVTGLSISTNQSLVSFLQDTIQACGQLVLRRRGGTVDLRHVERAVVIADAAALVGGLAAQRALRQRDDEPLARAAARTAGFWTAATGTAGVIVGGVERWLPAGSRGRRRSTLALLATTGALAAVGELGRRRRARLDAAQEADDADGDAAPRANTPKETARALAFGVGVSAGTAALGTLERRAADRIAHGVSRVLPGTPAHWRPVGQAVTLGAVTMAGRAVTQRAFSRVEARQGAVETAFDVAPPLGLLSGSHESHVPYATLSLQGRRFVWMTTHVDVVEQVMQEPVAAQPIRAYVGLDSAPSEAERVALALRELDRTNAFDRDWIMVVSPTGTGYVNYAAVSALEFLARGNCATVAMQYAARPSVLALRRVAEGRAHMRLLLDGIRARVQARPAGTRPKIVLFGESLGAWTSQDPFVGRGVQGLVDAGVDHAIWIGTPHFSKWKDQVLASNGTGPDSGAVGVFNHIDEYRTLDDAARRVLRYVMITHHDDGVALFGPELAIQSPRWLGTPSTRPSSVPKGMRWMPTTTFFQVLVDMKNSANVVPGVFDAKGHDYRADLLPFFHEVLGFDASPAQLDAIGTWLEHREKQRVEWVRAHGDAGRSLAVTVLERLMEQERAAGRDADGALLRLVRDVAEAEPVVP
jgi:uncharacterized membrane protein